MKNRTGKHSQEEIDALVTEEAENDSAWDKAARVRRSKPAPLQIPGELAARVTFLANLHREKSADAWLQRIIEERVQFEEAAFGTIKRELRTRRGA